MLPELIIRFLPITILLLLSFSAWTRRKLLSFPDYLSLLVCVVLVFSITALPDDYSIDKPRYVSLFLNRFYWGELDDYKDPGWMYYVTYCARVFRGNVYLFFLLTATVYVFSYQVFAKRFFQKQSFYFIIMAMGCLGFIAYATNTIRAGFAIAFLLFGFVAEKKAWKILLLFLSVTFHRSMIIPVTGYFIAGIFDKKWVYYMVWGVCLVLAIASIDLGPLFETFGFVDERIEGYGQSVSNQFSRYKKGFRWDFLFYSLVPLLILGYNTFKRNIKDGFLDRMTNTYVFANSIWLLAIRISYSDRLAYLSWFLIPFITLYPVIKYKDKYNNPNGLVIGIMSIFIGMNIVLVII